MLPFDVDTKALPLTSKSPPNCGVESSTTFDISEPETIPAVKVDLVNFLSPPPEVSTAKIHHHLQL